MPYMVYSIWILCFRLRTTVLCWVLWHVELLSVCTVPNGALTMLP